MQRLAVLLLLMCVAGRAHAQQAVVDNPRGEPETLLLGGLVGLAVSGGASALAWYSLSESRCNDVDCDGLALAILLTTSIPFVAAGGVTWAGNATGGQGSYLATLAFAALGTIPGAVWLGAQGQRPDSVVASAVGFALLTGGYLTGAVVGYQVSASATFLRTLGALSTAALGLAPGAVCFALTDPRELSFVMLGTGMLTVGFVLGAMAGYEFTDDVPLPTVAPTTDLRGVALTWSRAF